jgi:hypothetical protein
MRPRATRHGTISLRIMYSSSLLVMQAVSHVRFAGGPVARKLCNGTCACRSPFLLGTILSAARVPRRAPVHTRSTTYEQRCQHRARWDHISRAGHSHDAAARTNIRFAAGAACRARRRKARRGSRRRQAAVVMGRHELPTIRPVPHLGSRARGRARSPGARARGRPCGGRRGSAAPIGGSCRSARWCMAWGSRRSLGLPASGPTGRLRPICCGGAIGSCTPSSIGS